VWAIEGELRGHMVAETIKWLSDTADWADRQAGLRSAPSFIISPPESGWRRLFSRRGGRAMEVTRLGAKAGRALTTSGLGDPPAHDPPRLESATALPILGIGPDWSRRRFTRRKNKQVLGGTTGTVTLTPAVTPTVGS
jgi:hypothetical protein